MVGGWGGGGCIVLYCAVLYDRREISCGSLRVAAGYQTHHFVQ